MKYYTGDLHFGHKSVLKFDNRPFSDIDEMDRALNAGAMINNYIPVTFKELIVNNQIFKECN